MKRNSLFFAAFAVGKWNKNTLRIMFNKFEDYVKKSTQKEKLKIFSDGNDDYTTVLPEYFSQDCLCYGQKIKHKDGKKLFPPVLRKVYGNPKKSEIDTNWIECFNSILRGKLSKLVRRTKNHAKDKFNLMSSLYLFQFYWNFMHQLRKRATPAIMEGKAKKVWMWGNLLHIKLRDIS